MRGKYVLTLIVLTCLASLAIVSVPLPVQASPSPVKFYVDMPDGYIPGVPPGSSFGIDIYIEAPDLTYDSVGGMVQYRLDLLVDPDVFDLSRVRTKGAMAGYCLWDFADDMWYDYPTIFAGEANATTGYWKGISEVIMPTPATGYGEIGKPGWVSTKLIRLEFKTSTDPASETAYSKLNLLCEFRDADGVWHPVYDEDGHYNEPPTQKFLDYQGSLLPPGDPKTSHWHELYPNYCTEYDLTDWQDNDGDGSLSVCDNIAMKDSSTGVTTFWHVDDITVTLHLTLKPDQVEEMYVDFERGIDPPETSIDDPIGTQWHELYPNYCKKYQLRDWHDTNENRELDFCDQIVFMDKETGAEAEYHVEGVSTDIIISPGPVIPEFPLGIEIIMMLALLTPIIYLWRRKGRKK